jgi:hypothetical protein
MCKTAREGALYGQEAFRILAYLMDNVVRNGLVYDMRYTLLFYEHKQCMLMRIEYLQSFLNSDFHGIIESYKEVVKLASIIHICALKYNIKKDTAINTRIQAYFSKALALEKECLLNLVENLALCLNLRTSGVLS